MKHTFPLAFEVLLCFVLDVSPWFLGYQENLPSFCLFVCKLHFKVFLYFTDHTIYSLLARQIQEYFLTFLNFSLLVNKMMTKERCLVNFLWISLIKNELVWTSRSFEMQDRIWWNALHNQLALSVNYDVYLLYRAEWITCIYM